MRVASRHRGAFTLIELLVVVAIVALLMSFTLPALRGARDAARRAGCLANMRSLEIAQTLYANEHKGRLVGTSHGGSWLDALREYDPSFLLRSPVDSSPHFAGGEPIDGRYRVTSYAINYMLSPDNPRGVGKLVQVQRPSATAHFVLKSFTGPSAVADHVHPTLWWSPIRDLIPGKAATEVQTHAHGGPIAEWDAISTYGFLDGHAEARRFADVYHDRDRHSFDPKTAF